MFEFAPLAPLAFRSCVCGSCAVWPLCASIGALGALRPTRRRHRDGDDGRRPHLGGAGTELALADRAVAVGVELARGPRRRGRLLPAPKSLSSLGLGHGAIAVGVEFAEHLLLLVREAARPVLLGLLLRVDQRAHRPEAERQARIRRSQARCSARAAKSGKRIERRCGSDRCRATADLRSCSSRLERLEVLPLKLACGARRALDLRHHTSTLLAAHEASRPEAPARKFRAAQLRQLSYCLTRIIPAQPSGQELRPTTACGRFLPRKFGRTLMRARCPPGRACCATGKFTGHADAPAPHRPIHSRLRLRATRRGGTRGGCRRRRLDPSRRHGRPLRAEHLLRPRRNRRDAAALEKGVRRAPDDRAMRSASRSLRQGRLRHHHGPCGVRPACASFAAGDPRARQEGRRHAQSGNAGRDHRKRHRSRRSHPRNVGQSRLRRTGLHPVRHRQGRAPARARGRPADRHRGRRRHHGRNRAAFARAGANVLVAGSAVFKGGTQDAYAKNIAAIRNAAALVRGEAA